MRNSVQSTHSMDFVDTGGLSWNHDKPSRVISQDDDDVYIVQTPQKGSQTGKTSIPSNFARASKDSFWSKNIETWWHILSQFLDCLRAIGDLDWIMIV